MDVDEFQSQIYTSKYPRISSSNNGGSRSKSLVQHFPDSNNNNNNNEEHDRDSRSVAMVDPNNNNINIAAVDSMFRGWQNSSRIFRVSRASGGKDRHSKVLTSKGLRDRRVRLSVSTAIQFYDLQDRLGYDQPSKAVEWLIKAAADSIAELPSLTGPFVETSPRQIEDAKLGFEDFEMEAIDKNHLSKSASSTSETSKGSGGLSLTRVNQRVKARERARERAKEKESENDHLPVANDGQRSRRGGGGGRGAAAANNNTSSSSFTDLLTGHNQNGSSSNNTAPMLDYFTNNNSHEMKSRLFLGQTQMGMSSLNMQSTFYLTGSGEHQFSFGGGQESMIPSGNAYDLNFSMASNNNNRGTLQSNSPSSVASLALHHHNNLQRFGASMEGANNVPFFMSTSASSSSMETSHHHLHHQHHSQYSTGLDGGLHLYYGDGRNHSDHKDHKGKN